MEWQGISEFVVVAELQNFTKASKRLGCSTAHVSRQVSLLESRLQVVLFYRTTRHVRLTEEGQLFYRHCRALLDGLQEAEQVLSNLHAHPQGTIKLTAPTTYGEQFILPLLNDFMLTYPSIRVQGYLSNRQIDLLEEDYDLAIRVGPLADSSLVAKRLGERRNYLCAAPSYLEQHGTPHTLSELQHHQCLVGTLDYWRFSVDNRDKLIRVNGRLRYNSGYGLVDAALKGLGLVQLPDYYVQQHLARGELVSLLEAWQASPDGVWAVYPTRRQFSPKLNALVEYLEQHLRQQQETA